MLQAINDTRNEVRLLGGRNVVISTNVPTRQDGLPYASARQPDDAGVAVYFTRNGTQMCFACDRWRKVEENLHAVAKTIEALRGIARWGTGDMLKAAFTGFSALPAPAIAKEWWEVLGIQRTASADIVRTTYRRLASENHPDRPDGNGDRMAAINIAYAKAVKELGLQ